MNSEQIIRQARSGDIKSYEMLYNRYRGIVLNFIIIMGVTLRDAEEICDDVFLNVYYSIDKFQFKTEDER